MVKIIIKNHEPIQVKNYDDALRKCAELHLNGTPLTDIKIIDNTNNEAPVNITHLTRLKQIIY